MINHGVLKLFKFRKKLKKLKAIAEDDWVFKVDLMLGDFEKLEERVRVLEERFK